ncbi:sulfide:quinone oxidoreductase [Cyclonatronum proteinivorum]|uniref:Sulfide:quinone oxidoreductase n=1 Tax=Cyclonatronum proteinivorum TaxID=1457365 RepID=A0A345UI19_9BACT|nr:FAD/NAD(P)-binding oxidoreductase [Cyclonatronum proteinivorum]AXJ00121.1 sulfide:quinone oxidoreductase [Cyclonatronum proteinivorum]
MMDERNSPDGQQENESGGISRRDALKYIGFGGGALLVGGGAGVVGYRKSLEVNRRESKALRKLKIVVAGGSIAGLTVAARLLRAVPDMEITVIEPRSEHHYQPGYTLVAAGVYRPDEVIYDQASLMMPNMKWVKDYVKAFEPDENRVITEKGEVISYDYLVVAMGVQTNLDSVEGLRDALQTDHAANIYDVQSGIKFKALADRFERGKFVTTYPSGYVKCGGAPQKITWLTEDMFRRKGRREEIDVHFYSPQASLFPVVPKIDKIIMPMMEDRGMHNHYHTELKAISTADRVAYFEKRLPDGNTREVRQPYDLLHPMPRFQTPKPLREGPLTAEGIGGQVEVDRETLQHKRFPNVFAVGDCAATGAPKTAATIRKQAPAVAGNIVDVAMGRSLSNLYDGTSGCPLLTRHGRCMMFEFDFNGELVNEWIYQSTRETRLWWNFKVHILKQLYRNVMINGYV